jgi:UDP-GlcNAc3NAcA epimerase
MKIATIIGARPQFIKAAVVSRNFKSKSIQETIIHTGQHFDSNMSDIFFTELEIPEPTTNLAIGGGSHGQNTGRMIEAIEAELLRSPVDMVLVYGDTDSTLAATLAAVKLHLPVAHVESGLRSFNRRMPEEINRVLTDHAAEILFPPTETALKQLAEEGISGPGVLFTGDVMYDAAIFYGEKATKESKILETLSIAPGKYILSTLHRANNTDNKYNLNEIFTEFSIVEREIILPLHPRTRKRIEEFGLAVPENVRIIDPVGYLDMVQLEKNAALIATDSGGVQKEAFFHGTPCVTLRSETEWVELIEGGWNILAAPGTGISIAETIHHMIEKKGSEISPYGNGNAGEVIAQFLSDYQ